MHLLNAFSPIEHPIVRGILALSGLIILYFICRAIIGPELYVEVEITFDKEQKLVRRYKKDGKYFIVEPAGNGDEEKLIEPNESEAKIIAEEFIIKLQSLKVA